MKEQDKTSEEKHLSNMMINKLPVERVQSKGHKDVYQTQKNE